MKAPSLLLLFLFSLSAAATAQPRPPRPPEPDLVLDLRGTWLLHLGDDPAYASPHLRDDDWDEVRVPGAWEEEGFWGYDGFAWYRKHVHLPEHLAKEPLLLHLGRIDDTDEVFVNGRFVGATGRMPDEEYHTAYHATRRYAVPAEYLHPGDNVIAIRVFDERLEGGIIEGTVGFYRPPPSPLAVDLAGLWQFRTGDDLRWKAPKLDGRGWDDVTVPGRWEPQGYRRYNGFAWYRKQFFLPRDLDGADLVLLLGKIDDLDEVFLNGHRIGGTGNITKPEMRGTEWQVARRYPIPPEALRYGAYNVLAVRVYDGVLDGGIFSGPIGIITENALGSGHESLLDRLLRYFRDLE